MPRLPDVAPLPLGVFLARVRSITGGDLARRSTQEIAEAMAVANYAHELCLAEAEKRGLVYLHEEGFPVIDYPAEPPTAERVVTILTRTL